MATLCVIEHSNVLTKADYQLICAMLTHANTYASLTQASTLLTVVATAACAGMEDIGTARTTASGYAILLTLTAAFFSAAYSLYSGGTLLSKLLAAAPALLGVAITFALVRNAQFNK